MKPASEAGFVKTILQLAHRTGWRSFHQRPALTRRGWRSAVQGKGVGFPDLVLLRGNRLVVAEVKFGAGRPTPDQRDWLAAFRQVPGVEVHLWRVPDDWDIIEVVLA